MTVTATIVLSIIGTGIGVIGVLGAMLRILTTNVTRELQASATRISELKTDLGGRLDDTNKRIDEMKTDLGGRLDDTNKRVNDTNKRIDGLATEMHQRFDRVHQELGENRERMAKLEGALEGFLAGRRDRDAA